MEKKTVCILGWYGTETLGDRAILDGILSALYLAYGECNILLGSLYPFFTERTIYEDGEIYKNTAPGCNITIFDIKEKTRGHYIEKSDVVTMGGGPIMELNLLYLIYNCFKNAKSYGKKIIVLGCGIGPLYSKRLSAVAKKIISIADMAIFRDKKSFDFACKLTNSCNKYYVLEDPAVISIQNYREYHSIKDQCNYLAINFRQPVTHYPVCSTKIMDEFRKVVLSASNYYEYVKLVPMHTFYVGNDDRYYLTEIASSLNRSNVKVLQKPFNLYSLYSIYENAEACIGMRYHSIVMQTLLNGNNYILDYTNKDTGKISGFMNMLDSPEFYNNRYANLENDAIDINECIKILRGKNKYTYPITDTVLWKYCDLLKKI